MGCLEGVKVIDLTVGGAGPLTTRYLAVNGATVIHIESKKRLEIARTTLPFKDGIPGVNRAAYFAYLNPNKYGMALNLTHARAGDVARRLVAWADIVVENFVPGVMEKWGLSYENLRRIKPGIIMLRMSSRGQTGPYAISRAYGFHLTGLTGFMHFTGWPDRWPLPLAVAYTDLIGPRFGAVTLIAALEYRRRTGKGQLLDMSQTEAALSFLAPTILEYSVNGTESGRMGNSCPYAAPHGIYRCRGDERWCAIAVFTEEEWRAFCKVIGSPTWTSEPKFATLAGRKENEDELNKLVEEWTISYTSEQVMKWMQAAGVQAGVVMNPQDLYEDSHLDNRNAFLLLEHTEMGAVSSLADPFRLSKTPAQPKMSGPCLGEHTEYICKQFLGMSEEEFAELLDAGIFE